MRGNAQQTMARPAVALAVQLRSIGDGGGFSRSTMRHRNSTAGTALATLLIGQTAGRIGCIRHTMDLGNCRGAI